MYLDLSLFQPIRSAHHSGAWWNARRIELYHRREWAALHKWMGRIGISGEATEQGLTAASGYTERCGLAGSHVTTWLTLQNVPMRSYPTCDHQHVTPQSRDCRARKRRGSSPPCCSVEGLWPTGGILAKKSDWATLLVWTSGVGIRYEHLLGLVLFYRTREGGR